MKRAIFINISILLVIIFFVHHLIDQQKVGGVVGGFVIVDKKFFATMDECTAEVKKVVEASSGISKPSERRGSMFGNATYDSLIKMADGSEKSFQCMQFINENRVDYTFATKPAVK